MTVARFINICLLYVIYIICLLLLHELTKRKFGRTNENNQIHVFFTWHSLTRFCTISNISKNGLGCATNQKISKYWNFTMMQTFSELVFGLSFLKMNTYVKLSMTQMAPFPSCPAVEAALTASVSNEDPLDPSCYRIQRENNSCKATVSYLNVFFLTASKIRHQYPKTLKYCSLSTFFNISKILMHNDILLWQTPTIVQTESESKNKDIYKSITPLTMDICSTSLFVRTPLWITKNNHLFKKKVPKARKYNHLGWKQLLFSSQWKLLAKSPSHDRDSFLSDSEKQQKYL